MKPPPLSSPASEGGNKVKLKRRGATPTPALPRSNRGGSDTRCEIGYF